MSFSINNDPIIDYSGEDLLQTADSTHSSEVGVFSDGSLVYKHDNHLEPTRKASVIADPIETGTSNQTLVGCTKMNQSPSVSWTDVVAGFFKAIGRGIAWAVSSAWAAVFGSATKSNSSEVEKKFEQAQHHAANLLQNIDDAANSSTPIDSTAILTELQRTSAAIGDLVSTKYGNNEVATGSSGNGQKMEYSSGRFISEMESVIDAAAAKHTSSAALPEVAKGLRDGTSNCGVKLSEIHKLHELNPQRKLAEDLVVYDHALSRLEGDSPKSDE